MLIKDFTPYAEIIVGVMNNKSKEEKIKLLKEKFNDIYRQGRLDVKYEFRDFLGISPSAGTSYD